MTFYSTYYIVYKNEESDFDDLYSTSTCDVGGNIYTYKYLTLDLYDDSYRCMTIIDPLGNTYSLVVDDIGNQFMVYSNSDGYYREITDEFDDRYQIFDDGIHSYVFKNGQYMGDLSLFDTEFSMNDVDFTLYNDNSFDTEVTVIGELSENILTLDLY